MRTILLCLHGWGGSKESFSELRAALRHLDLEILTPDLPGFGAEPEPDRPWTTDDYANWVVDWFEKRRAESGERSGNRKLLVLGHSHGGRIAIKLAWRQSMLTAYRLPLTACHLYLCASAGIRHPRHCKRIIGLTLAKAGKFLLSIPGLRLLQPMGKRLLYTLVRVHDYEKATPVMRETLIKVSQEDLRPLLPRIHVPTDLFWGSDDRQTPLIDGEILRCGIDGSHLRVYPGVRHAVHRSHVCLQDLAHLIGAELHVRSA